MNKKLNIKVGNLKDALKAFKETWENAEKDQLPKDATEELFFENSVLLLKTLTPRRLELMQFLHTNGPSSIRALSKHLNRDYKNVYSDVKMLDESGLLLHENSQYSVPWDLIKTEIPMFSKVA